MGIWLYTGLPGAGKTLCVVKELVEQILKPDSSGNHPTVYADIKGLEYEKLGVRRLVPEDCEDQKEAVEHCRKWYDVEDGSYVIIDECQRVFPVRNAASHVPRHVSEFETHRHKGLNILLITQGPNLIDKHVRTLVERHTHLKRIFGGSSSIRLEWPRCEEQLSTTAAYKSAMRSRFKFPEKYFALYKSANVHVQHQRYPVKLLITLAVLVTVTLSSSAYAIYGFLGDDPPPSGVSSAQNAFQAREARYPASCAVSVAHLVGGEIYFLDLASNREFRLPQHVVIERTSDGDFLRNVQSGNRYLICPPA